MNFSFTQRTIAIADSTKLSEIASDSSRRQHFAKSVVTFCMDYHFDGIDLDYQNNPFNKSHFTAMVKDLKEEFRFVYKHSP